MDSPTIACHKPTCRKPADGYLRLGAVRWPGTGRDRAAGSRRANGAGARQTVRRPTSIDGPAAPPNMGNAAGQPVETTRSSWAASTLCRPPSQQAPSVGILLWTSRNECIVRYALAAAPAPLAVAGTPTTPCPTPSKPGCPPPASAPPPSPAPSKSTAVASPAAVPHDQQPYRARGAGLPGASRMTLALPGAPSRSTGP